MIGILWMDDGEREVAWKIKEAAKCYQSRFGSAATICYANPKDVAEAQLIAGLRVEPRRNILPHHFLVGREEESAQEVAA